MRKAQEKTVRDLLHMTQEAPLLAACAVPLSEAQILVLDHMEALTNQWFAHRRRSVKAACELWKDWAEHNPSSPFEAARNMIELTTGSMNGFGEDLSEASRTWFECCVDLTKGMTVAGIVSARTAEAVIPTKPVNHSTPV